MKFGCFVPQGWRLDLVGLPAGYPQYQAMRFVAEQAERLGYHSAWLFDHFHTIPDVRPEACFEAWTGLAALAEATSRIRLGHMCGCNVYRPPALLAKMASCVDVISNGRLELGLGAGWYQHEMLAYGYPFEKPSIRIGQLDEAAQIIKGLWEQDQFQFQGQHYTVGVGQVRNYRGQEETLQGAVNFPKPVQKNPPLWLAGGGEQLTLRTVARYADWSNFMGDLATIQKKNEILDQHCEKIGRDPASIHRSIIMNAFSGSEKQFQAIVQRSGRNEEDVATLRQILYPKEPQAMIDRLNRLRQEARIECAIIYFLDAVECETMQWFAKEVAPHCQ